MPDAKGEAAIDRAPYPSWMAKGRCRTHPDPRADFMHQIANAGSLKLAKEICAYCPVLAECIEWAAAVPSCLGYWGSSEIARVHYRGGKRTLEDLIEQARREGVRTNA